MSTETPLRSDHVRRFIFEDRPVRGHWVHAEEAWRALRAHGHYPPAVNELLGQAVAAAVLLAATLKFRGTLTFQLQGNGAVSLLVAQCTHDFRLRAVARCDEEAVAVLAQSAPHGVLFRKLAGTEGRITVTVEAHDRSTRYQGVVPLAGDSLAQSLEAYFASSEQLPTRVHLAADEERAAGVLVQKLPGAGTDDTDEEASSAAWEEAEEGMERISARRLLSDAAEDLLAGAFPGQDLRLFRGSAVRFECRCNPRRVAGVLRALGPGEIRELLREQGSVTVTCEFCHRPYKFDSIDVEALFADGPGASPALH
jgi:molecular chaperone Hsp33